MNGGRDKWNQGPTGYVEANGCLDIALRVGKILQSNNIDVIYTRIGDYNLEPWTDKGFDLSARADFANKNKADIYVSIHTNAGPASAHGTETYCYSKGGNGEKLANLIQSNLINSLGLYNRGIKTANFAVLRLTNMPAVLTEIAFHTNAREEILLKDSGSRDKMALAIASGIGKYFGITISNELSELIAQANKLKEQLNQINSRIKELGGVV